MKKLGIVIALLVMCLTLFITCKKDPEVNIEEFEIATEELSIGPTTASIVGTYSYSGKIEGIKVFVADNEAFAHSKSFEAEIEGKTFTIEIAGLQVASTYHYYYSIDYGFAKPFKTSSKTFITPSESPTVKTLEALPLDSITFRIKCEVVSGGGQDVIERGICWNTYGDPTLEDETLKNEQAGLGQYTLRMENLDWATTYYVRAYAKNATGIGFGDVIEFRTGTEVVMPQVSSVEVSDITANGALVMGNVSSDGGATLAECGVCWGTNPNPSLSNHHQAADGVTMGVFTVNISGLNPNRTYYVRCYATNALGTAYGENLSFTTTEGLPKVTTSGITNITATSAKGGGNVTDEGASSVTERGICWSTNHNPTISDSHAFIGTGPGNYTVSMTNLTPNATYYVRAYAKNAQGITYGSEVSFTALEGLPEVTTQDVSDLTATSAKGHGTVTDQGGSAVTERGICWSNEPSPTIADSHANSGTGAGSFTVNITGLTPGTKYYVRAYAINTQGTSYGDQKEFTTGANLPTVTTSTPIDVTQTTATGKGEVTDDGGSTVTERGVCWSTEHNPTTAGSHASSGTGTGAFTVSITGLNPGTTYYVRAYAINSEGTSYGNEVSMATTADKPTVTTGAISNITQTTALGSGNVTSDGGASVTERGICWSTSHNPTTSNSHASNGSGIGGYTVNMAGLTANTTYYVRAYAINSQGTSYGNEVSFTTAETISAPNVTTGQVTNIAQTTATGVGEVTGDGGATVTERGVCWSTSHNPTTSGSHASSGTGTGSFTVNMTGLTPNTTYYVRAYAINSAGTSYGNEVNFTTAYGVTLPIITISDVTDISTTTATCGGNVMSAGNGTVSARGVCWSTAQNPTISNSHTTDGVGIGVFVSQITGLTDNTVYYIRAYATNEAGTAYSEQKTFTTIDASVFPTLTPQEGMVSSITSTTAEFWASLASNGGPEVIEMGFCYSTSPNPTIYDNHTCGSLLTTITGLSESTTYYVRAYATITYGTVYSEQVRFSTISSGNMNAPTGAIDGSFTINDNGDKVYFSKGNLQYQASTNTWRFAEHQWDYVGSAEVSSGEPGGTVVGSSNHLVSPTYNGWIDLFGWGTSGYDHGAICYQPYSTDANSYGYLAYGNRMFSLYHQTGKADWGYNRINNGGNIENNWRTLSSAEWAYIRDSRNTISGIRYAKAMVNGVNGVILLPDDWDSNDFSLQNTNQGNVAYNSNIISAAEWNNVFEANGAVFLPAGGVRSYNNSTPYYTSVGLSGFYWTSNKDNMYKVLSFSEQSFSGFVSLTDNFFGCSIRLVSK